jgi:hypothetical protein
MTVVVVVAESISGSGDLIALLRAIFYEVLDL